MLVEALEPLHAVGLTCSKASTFTLLDSGDLYSWGSGKHGCLGIGSEADQFTPCKVDYPRDEHDKPISKISAGKHHFVMLSSSGTKLWAWGNNKHAQLSLGDTELRKRPEVILVEDSQTYRQVEAPVLSVVCGYSSTFLLTGS